MKKLVPAYIYLLVICHGAFGSKVSIGANQWKVFDIEFTYKSKQMINHPR